MATAAYQKARRDRQELTMIEIPRDLHRELKIRAAQEGTTMIVLLRKLLEGLR